MKVLAEKAAVLAVCVALLFVTAGATAAPITRADGVSSVSTTSLAWLLGAVALSGLCGAVDRPQSLLLALPSAYLLVACLTLTSLAGLPLVTYDLGRGLVPAPTQHRALALSAAVPLALRVLGGWGSDAGGTVSSLLHVVVAVLAGMLAASTTREEHAQAERHRLHDDLNAKVRALDTSRVRLQEAQDLESRAAALAERTRIAREIHDGVGHQLTRLLFQVRALQVTHREEPKVVADLAAVAATVGETLDSMRRSVHQLADEGEELATAMGVLGSRCGIPQVSVDCAIAQPPVEVSRCLLAVAREALTNAARHGRAHNARVVVADFPAFWRIAVDNDGLVPSEAELAGGEGLGLRSMRERVEALGGSLRFNTGARLKVLATIPKERA